MEYDLRKATGRRIVHHEKDALDRRLVGEPPLLGLEVVAGAGLLVFGHLCFAAGSVADSVVCGSLPKLAVLARAGSVLPKEASAGGSAVLQPLRHAAVWLGRL